MEKCIVIFILNFVIDYVLLLSINNIFKLRVKKLNLFFLEIFNLCNLLICLYFDLKSYWFILGKLIVEFIIILLITDSYKLKRFVTLYFSFVVLMFSYYGFFKFLTALVKVIFKSEFNKNLSYFGDLTIVFLFFCYIFAVFILVSKLAKIKKLKSLLRKVSFFAFGKHIEIMGLLDSGNVLYDTKTNLPVIIINAKIFAKYLSAKDYENITKGNYSNLQISHYLSVVTISKEETDLPIIVPKSVVISDGEKVQNVKCVIGLVSHNFENANAYQCLLHRDCF